MKHYLSKVKKEFKMIIAVAMVLAMAIIATKSIYAILTVSKTKANTLGIMPTHTVTYTYYEVDRNGQKTPIERTENYTDFEGTTISLGSDPSHAIVSDRYSGVKFVIEGTEYDTGDSYVIPARDVTIAEDYYIVTHNVTYDYATNGGQKSESDTAGSRVQEYNLDEEISLSETAYKSGWTFVGWNTDSASTTPLSSLVMGTSDITLYALYVRLAPDAPVVSVKLDNASGAEYAQGTWTNHDLFITLNPQNVDEDIARYEIYKNGEWVSTGITMTGKTGTLIISDDMDDTVSFRSVDSLGNTSSETTVSIKRDTVKPTMTFDGTLDKQGNRIYLTVTTADQGGSGLVSNRGTYYVSTSPDSITGNSGTYTSETQFSFSAPAGNDYYIFVEVTEDHAGNYSGNDADLVTIDGVKYHRVGPYDRINPTVQIEAVDYDTLRWTGVDTNPITHYAVIERSTTSTAVPTEWTDISVSPTGIYDIDISSHKYVYVWVKDEQGNTGYAMVSTRRLRINPGDHTTLVIKNVDENGEVISAGYIMPGSDLYLTGTADFGYNTLIITANGTDYEPGTVYVKDDADTTITSRATLNTYNITYDFAGGEIASGETLVTTVNYNTRFNVSNPAARPGYTFLGWTSSVADGLGPNAKTAPLGGSYLSSFVDWDGTATTNKGYYNLTDINEGTVKLTATWRANADKPIITAKLNDAQGASYSAGSWTNQNIYIGLSQSDANNQIDHYEWYRNGEWTSAGITTENNIGTLTINENIDETLTFRAVSVTGYISGESTISVKRDNIKPTIVYTGTQSADYSKVTLSITCNDTGGSELFDDLESGRRQYMAYKSTSPTSISNTNYTNYTSQKDGIPFDMTLGSTSSDYYIFILQIRDNAYNYSETDANTVQIDGKYYYRLGPYRYDVTAPVVQIDTVDYDTFRWSATDLSNIVGYNITKTTSSNAPQPEEWIPITVEATGTYDIDTTGQYIYKVWVIDEYGNVGQKLINPSRMHIEQGANTIFEVRENDENGHLFTDTFTYIMEGTNIYAKAELIPDMGYTVSITRGSSTMVQGEPSVEYTYTHTGSTTIKSVATAYKYTILYDYDGGQAGSGTSTINATYDNRATVQNPTKAGFTFKGWTSSVADGLGPNAKTAASASASVSNFSAWDGSMTTNKGFLNLTDVNNGTVTLTAHWAYNNYEVLNGSTHVAYYETLEEALANAPTSRTIRVLNDVTDTSNPVLASGKTITLDLNGYTITASNKITNNGNLTINDSSSDETGSIVAAGCCVANEGSGTLVINGGTFETTVAGAGHTFSVIDQNSTGTITINGGDFTADDLIVALNNTGKLTVNNGNLVCNNETAIFSYNINTSVDVNGGYIEGHCAIYTETGVTVNVTGTPSLVGTVYEGVKIQAGSITVTGGDSQGPTIRGKLYGISSTTGSVTVTGNAHIVGEERFGIDIREGGTLTLGNNNGNVSKTQPLVETLDQTNTYYGVYLRNNTGTFNFYDGKIIAPPGKTIVGPSPVTPTGYVVYKYQESGKEIAILAGEAIFAEGTEVNKAMKTLAAGSTVSDYSATDTSITTIAKYTGTSMPSNVNAVRVDAADSEAPIFMWYSNGTIYWWSPDSTPSLNEDASYMFYRLQNMTNIDGVSTFNTTGTTNMRAIFGKSDSVHVSPTNVDALENWDVSNVTSIREMFQNWGDLDDVDGLSNWNTENVVDMSSLFYECTSLTEIDLSNFETNNVTNMAQMFQGCSSLTAIYASTDFVTTAVTDSAAMFDGCTAPLDGGAGTTYNASNPKDKTYAHLDGGVSNPGYFRSKTAYNFVEIDNSTNSVIKTYVALQDALATATTGNKIAVVNNYLDTSNPIVTSGKNITLDLNGKTLDVSSSILNRGTLTIVGAGTLQTSEAINLITNNANCTLNLEQSGTITSNYTGEKNVIYGSGILNINCTGTISSQTGTFVISGGTINLTKGNIISEAKHGVYTNVSFNMTDGLVRAKYGMAVAIGGNGNATISGGLVEKTANSSGIWAGGACVQNSGTGIMTLSGGTIQNHPGNSSNVIYNASIGQIIVDGATVQNLSNVQAGANAGAGTIIVKSGIVSSAGGAGLNNNYTSSTSSSYGTIDIRGGTVTTTGTRALYNTSNYGKILISGGTITTSGGNSNEMGAVENDNNGNEIVVTGGTITAANSCAVHSSVGTVTIGIDDGTVNSSTTALPKIEGSRYGVRVTSGTFNFYDGVIIGGNGTGTAISGTVSGIPSGYTINKSTSGTKETAVLVLQNSSNSISGPSSLNSLNRPMSLNANSLANNNANITENTDVDLDEVSNIDNDSSDEQNEKGSNNTDFIDVLNDKPNGQQEENQTIKEDDIDTDSNDNHAQVSGE